MGETPCAPWGGSLWPERIACLKPSFFSAGFERLRFRPLCQWRISLVGWWGVGLASTWLLLGLFLRPLMAAPLPVTEVFGRDPGLAPVVELAPLPAPLAPDLSPQTFSLALPGGQVLNGLWFAPPAGAPQRPAVVVDAPQGDTAAREAAVALARAGFAVLLLSGVSPGDYLAPVAERVRLGLLFQQAAQTAPSADPWAAPVFWAFRQKLQWWVQARLLAQDWLLKQPGVDRGRVGLWAFADGQGLGPLLFRRDHRYGALLFHAPAPGPQAEEKALAHALARLGFKDQNRPWQALIESPGDYPPCPPETPHCGALLQATLRSGQTVAALQENWRLSTATPLLLTPPLPGGLDPAAGLFAVAWFCGLWSTGLGCPLSPDLAPPTALTSASVQVGQVPFSPSVNTLSQEVFLSAAPLAAEDAALPPWPPPPTGAVSLSAPTGEGVSLFWNMPQNMGQGAAENSDVVLVFSPDETQRIAWVEGLTRHPWRVAWTDLSLTDFSPLTHHGELGVCCLLTVRDSLAATTRKLAWLLGLMRARWPTARVWVMAGGLGATAALGARQGGAPMAGMVAWSGAGAFEKLVRKNLHLLGDFGALTTQDRQQLKRLLGPLDPAGFPARSRTSPVLVAGGQRDRSVPPDITLLMARRLGVKALWLPLGHFGPPAAFEPVLRALAVAMKKAGP